MKVTKKQLKQIIREEYSRILKESYHDDSHSSPRGIPRRIGSLYNTDFRGDDSELESEVRSAYKQGRTTEEGRQTQGVVDDLWALKNEPENFSKIPTKEMFLADQDRYSPAVPKRHVEWLWNYYMILGREL